MVIGYWSLVIGHWLLVISHWSLEKEEWFYGCRSGPEAVLT